MSEAITAESTRKVQKPAAKQDLEVKRLPPLNWESGHVSESLTLLRDYAVELVEDSIGWYRKAKRPMKLAGRRLRFAAIVLGAIAGLIPILAELVTAGDQPLIPPLWSAVAVGLAATLVLVDKFYGCTSAWVRHLMAELELQELLKAFTFDWESSRLKAQTPDPTQEQAIAMVESCRQFLIQAHAIVRNETQKWAAEFQTLLHHLDEAAKPPEEPRKPPASSPPAPGG
jgi:hypothetical protein